MGCKKIDILCAAHCKRCVGVCVCVEISLVRWKKMIVDIIIATLIYARKTQWPCGDVHHWKQFLENDALHTNYGNQTRCLVLTTKIIYCVYIWIIFAATLNPNENISQTSRQCFPFSMGPIRQRVIINCKSNQWRTTTTSAFLQKRRSAMFVHNIPKWQAI